MRVMDLAGWVPQPSGSFTPGGTFPTTADQVFIERAISLFGDHLVFSCKFGKQSVAYHFPMLDEKTGKKLMSILDNNVGKTLLSIGTIEIPDDDE